MTLLTIANNVVSEIGPRFTSVYANTNDDLAQQIVALANRAGKSLHRRHAWQALIKEEYFFLPANATFETLPDDFGRIIPDSMFDRTTWRKIEIPTNSSAWQRLNAVNAPGGLQTYARIQGGEFKFFNVSATMNIYYEYVSSSWINTADSSGLSSFAADTDVPIISEDLLTLDIIWRLKKAKGLADWETDAADAEQEITRVIGQEQTAKQLSLNPGPKGADIVPDRGYGV